jgi:hypothetical protein
MKQFLAFLSLVQPAILGDPTKRRDRYHSTTEDSAVQTASLNYFYVTTDSSHYTVSALHNIR